MKTKKPTQNNKDKKLDAFRDNPKETELTTDQGIGVSNTDDSLKAGSRGPTLLEDFHFREKIMRFDHERIPERAVHARGAAAHGYFQVYKSMKKYTKAAFLNDPKIKTPVFVRFSTVVGSRGSADTARDVRGFATKFYTTEGNFDLVGNNIPVFFIQDGIKFPDLVHAVKPEPANEIPQAGSAHDTFWDFVSLTPETAHMIMWVMSDRALPRSLAMMEGFGVHTFRLVNDQGKAVLVKFHWKPLLGTASLVWDEAQIIAGKDPDFHRRDLFDSIERGDFPEFEFGVQIIEEKDVLKYGFDLLDATKLLPEELVPVLKIGKMTLNRNPDNYFAETEQVAFCPGNIVPGIDFTNDPLLQARLFSYLDTQLTRLGGPNFADIPINRPIVPVNNHQQDGHMQTNIHTSKALYHPNSVGGGFPLLAGKKTTAFVHHEEKLDGTVIRERSNSFKDHFSQAKLFFDSQTGWEKQHIVEALQFELGKVQRKEVRERVLDLLANINSDMAKKVSERIGVDVPKTQRQRPSGKSKIEKSPALSLESSKGDPIKGRCIAILAENGVNGSELSTVKKHLENAGAQVEVVARALGNLKTSDGKIIDIKKSFLTTASVMYDGVYVPGGKKSVDALMAQEDAMNFVKEAFKHFKTIGGISEGLTFLKSCKLKGISFPKESAKANVNDEKGVVIAKKSSDASALAKMYLKSLSQHRHWERD